MKRLIKWGVLAVLVLVIGAGLTYYFYVNSIVRSLVETQGTKQMNLKTELNGARVSLFGGSVGLDDLKIANPAGYSAQHLFTLSKVDVKAPLGQLRGNPKRVSNITLEKPKFVIERGADGKFNFRQAIDNMPTSEPQEPQQPQQSPAGDEMKLIIDELLIQGAVVVVRPGISLPGVAPEYTLPIPAVTMKNIGNDEKAQNGAAMRDVVQQVLTVLAANASNSELLPKELRGLLSMDVNQIVAELGNRLGKQVQERIAAAVPGEMGKQISAIAGDPNAMLKDPGKALEGLGRNLPTSNPSDALKDPGKAVDGLKGLLGGKDKKKSKN